MLFSYRHKTKEEKNAKLYTHTLSEKSNLVWVQRDI